MKTTHQFVLTDEYVAEAQRLAIAQNKTLKFFYQTWWAWWLPRVGMVGFIIYFVANDFDWSLTAMFSAFLALSIFGEWFGRRGLAKARSKVRFKGSTTIFSMDENGIDIVGEAGNSHMKWSGMLSPAIKSNGVLVRFSQFGWVWLPDMALVEGSADDVRKLLAEYLKAASQTGRSS